MSSAHEKVLRREDPHFLKGQGTFIAGLRHPQLEEIGRAHV